jgi:large subunit ribosomal protein L24
MGDTRKKKKFKLRRDDQVMVISGKDKGKTGRILRIDPENERVLVEGVNIVKKAMRKKSQQDRGGIVEIEAPIHISNVQFVTKNGKPSRLGTKAEGSETVRVAKKTGETV